MADLFKNQKVPLKEPYESNTFSKVFSPGISPPNYRPDSRLNQNYVDNQNLNEMESKQSLEDKNFIKQLKSNNELLFKASKIFNQFALYPLKALRWQCQIHSESYKYHTTPFTLMPVFYNLNFYGFYTLWKGCFSMAAYNGIKTILESVLAELTTWEKNIEDVKKTEKLYGHIGLKMLSSAWTTPILTAVIYESVQSGISNENFGLVDLARETYNRITGYRYNYRTRMISLWSLIIPNSLYFLGFHFLSVGFEQIFLKLINLFKKVFNDKRRICNVDEVEAEVVDQPYTKALSELFSYFSATLALYPIETILNRLMVQGTRTIIDNTDNGYGVIPINTRYDGFFDCAKSIQETEGFLGFYKGVGTLLVEALIAYAILNFGKTVALRIFDSEWTTRSDMNNMKNLMKNSIN
ncbi:Solute carrier family 25 member [Brachionus plicatilis]|uniref:Solute carrier family 25 member n=1 Tax=Brachionus plicatilis TaxID=10195 RepID=A0A3M7QAR4_BRAPC|nr:Solute carrier family 25 member [Brachionus plicatilis]